MQEPAIGSGLLQAVSSGACVKRPLAGRAAWVAAGLLVLVSPARAAETNALRPGWYAAPLYTVLQFDRTRGSGDADGYALAIGHDWRWLGAEVRGEYTEALGYTDRYRVPGANPGDPPQERRVTSTARVYGGALAFTVEPFRILDARSWPWLRGLYTTAGVGIVKFDVRRPRPEAGADRPLRGDSKHYPYEAGLGYRYAFTVLRSAMALRVQGMYRIDREPRDPGSEPDPQQRYTDLLFHAGVQIPLGKPAPEPPAPVAAPVVVPPAFNDADNDGVIDELDQCPATPEASLVNNVGCVPERVS